MYKVPLEIPKYCNKCPFGFLRYSFPLMEEGYEISQIDGKKDKAGTHGYVCNLDFHENGRYTKVHRADIDKDIKKPKDCRLVDLGGRDERKEIVYV